MHRVDAVGIFTRITELGCVVQRSYSVRGPLSLVHIDTNHKLIRYNVVIFGGVDGYSRKVLYLDATTNNRAKTAFSFFLRSAQLHGLPSRVRADQGVENLDIAHFMFATRGTGRGSFISGKSVHNQRVERLWRDVWIAVTSKYHDILHSLEEDGLLDISDVIHLFGVHYIFVPRLRADLVTFVGGWNNHPLRTEGGLTPEQLWCMGHLQELDEGERLEELQDPGIDWESAVLQEESNSTVVVPEVECPLDEETLEGLQRTINPLEHSEYTKLSPQYYQQLRPPWGETSEGDHQDQTGFPGSRGLGKPPPFLSSQLSCARCSVDPLREASFQKHPED
ncbi:uncharacterized protein LOC120718119 [Simochromis diagramma]|uniref:uncharacterized protein LOC120718119 n=1 Tax=Simochromis diagramma TaxID=43689 RepID=UPI001A7EB34F|nr:uncharacterized protein LOC120718119 [Simochromis diagramma]